LSTVNLPLPDARLRLFIQGRDDWLEEGLLVPARKNKRGRIVEEGSTSALASSAQPSVVPPFGGILFRQVITEGHKSKHGGGGWCTGTPTKLCSAQRKLHGALRTISPTATKRGHNWRVCCEKCAKRRSHPSQRGSTW
jgi:hypothetical protein